MDDPDEARPDPPPSEDASPEHDRPRLEVSGIQVCASALASVSSAVIASFFGVADTLAGAAIASVVATMGSAVYGLWIRRGHERLKETEATRLVARARAGVAATAGPAAARARATTAAPTGAGTPPAVPGKDHDPDDPAGPDGDRRGWWAWLSQRRRGVFAGMAAVFLLTVGIITVIELVAQQPLAGVTGDSSGRTSIGRVIGGSSSVDEPEEPGTTTTTVGTGTSTTAEDVEAPSDRQATTTTTEAEPGSPADGGDAPDDGTTTTTSGASTTTTSSPAPAELGTPSQGAEPAA